MQEDINTQLPPAGGDPIEIIRDTIKPYLLDARENYPEPFYLLEYNGVQFSPLGGIQAFSGQKKNGKTFLAAQLLAAVLAPDSQRVHDYLPGLSIPQRTLEHLGHLPVALYVDTEMERLNTAKVLRRVHWLCEWDMSVPNERFHVLWTRTLEAEPGNPTYKKRWQLIKDAIEVLKPDFVIIDGIRDIVGDFNDNAESSQLIQELMALAEKKEICVWNTLHMNPRPSNDDESKMRGHLGTELGNKVTDTLVTIKSKTEAGVKFTVKQLDARNKDLDDWSFIITDDAGSLGIPRIVGTGANLSSKSREVSCDDPKIIREWIEKAKELYQWPMTRSEVKKTVFGEIGGVKNTGRQHADLQAAINLKFLEESTVKAGNGSYMLQPPDDLPF